MEQLNRNLFFILNMLLCSSLYSNECREYNSQWPIDTLDSIIKNNPDCVNIIDSFGQTWLFKAVKCRNYENVEILIQNGVSPSKKCSIGTTAFSNACYEDKKMVSIFLSNGYNPSAEEINQGLCFALQSMKYDIARFLIDSLNSEINKISNTNFIYFNPLDPYRIFIRTLKSDPLRSLMEGYIKDSAWLKMLEYLVEKGVDPNSTIVELNALRMDIFNPDKNFSLKRENKYIIDTLISTSFLIAFKNIPMKHDYDYNSNFNKGIKLLIEIGADVNFKGKDGIAPVHLVAENENVELMELLIRNGADINVSDINGWTPFLISLNSKDNGDIMKVLIENHVQMDSVRHSHR